MRCTLYGPALLFLAALTLAGCGIAGESGTSAPTDTIEVSTPSTPSFEPQQVDEVVADSVRAPFEDPGLNVEWEYQGATSGPVGGTVITVKLHNLNEVPLPTDAFSPPILRYSQGGNMVDAPTMDSDSANELIGLDRPLGAGASVNLFYIYNVSPGNLYDAELKVGNVVFRGNLNF